MNSQPESQLLSNLDPLLYRLFEISYLHRHHGYIPEMPVMIGSAQLHHSPEARTLPETSYESLFLFNKPEINLGGAEDA